MLKRERRNVQQDHGCLPSLPCDVAAEHVLDCNALASSPGTALSFAKATGQACRSKSPSWHATSQDAP